MTQPLKGAGLILLLLVCLVATPGCASTAKEPAHTAPLAEQSDNGGVVAAAAQAPNPYTAPYDKQKAGAQAKKAKPAKAAKAAKTTIIPTGTRMLQSAGRDASAQQPENGFTLNVPDSVGDGEAFLVEFGAEGAKKVQISWRDKNLSLEGCSGPDKLCRALLPVPLDEKAKHLPLSMTVAWENGKSEKFYADLPVKKRKYPVQSLKVASKFVSPPPEMQDKIKRDRAELSAAISKFTSTRYWNPPFLRPVPGEVTSLYGLRRVFNGQPKSPHKGVDFDAKQGDPILAVEDGIVVLVSEHYYSGNIVIVDHGLGVFSSYIHMSGFNVQKGQKVSRGDVVGYIGSTGRVTGPHLHLSLFVLGVSVNAAACIAM